MGEPLPILLLRRGTVRPRLLDSLIDDPRFEFLLVRSLSAEWRTLAHHAAATFVAVEGEPFGALTYALTGGIKGPIVMLVGRRWIRDCDDLIAAGAVACVAMPVSPSDRDMLAGILRDGPRPARVDATLRLMLDPISRTVRYRRRVIELSQREFALLYCLSSRSGEPVPADEIMHRVWRDGSLESRQRLDVYVYQLRRKLGALGMERAVVTVRGYGYALCAVKASRTRKPSRAAKPSRQARKSRAAKASRPQRGRG